MESLHQISTFLNENAETIKAKMRSDRKGAEEFLTVCEESGFVCNVVHIESGTPIHWREAPEELIIEMALKMFDVCRKRCMN